MTWITILAAKRGAGEAVYSGPIGRAGSISAKHFVGQARRDWAMQPHLDERALMRQLKLYLEPWGILNPGRVSDVEVPQPCVDAVAHLQRKRPILPSPEPSR